MSDVAGDVVLVTGASRGLGRSMAARLSREGARVVPTARDAEALSALADASPTEMLPRAADVRDPGRVAAVVDAAVDHFGRLDGLVNNAAVGMLSLASELRDVEAVDPADWETIVETNLTGPFLCTKYALAHLRDGGGHVVNVSSAYGKHGAAGWAPYVSSKHGLEGLTKTVALETADEPVAVNGLSPAGSVDTGFWNTEEKRSHLPPAARDRVQEPDVMDDAVVALLAQGPAGVTGESLTAPEWEERLDV